MIFQYDASKDKCPLPLVNLRLMLKKMQPQDTCIIKLCDSGSKADIPKLLKKLGFYFHQSQLENNQIKIIISCEEKCLHTS